MGGDGMGGGGLDGWMWEVMGWDGWDWTGLGGDEMGWAWVFVAGGWPVIGGLFRLGGWALYAASDIDIPPTPSPNPHPNTINPTQGPPTHTPTHTPTRPHTHTHTHTPTRPPHARTLKLVCAPPPQPTAPMRWSPAYASQSVISNTLRFTPRERPAGMRYGLVSVGVGVNWVWSGMNRTRQACGDE